MGTTLYYALTADIIPSGTNSTTGTCRSFTTLPDIPATAPSEPLPSIGSEFSHALYS